MSRELSRNQRRLAAIAAFGVFWGAFLVTIGFPPLFVGLVLGPARGGRRARVRWTRIDRDSAPPVEPGRPRGPLDYVRAAGTPALRTFRAASSRVARIDWQAMRHTARRRATPAARIGRQAAATAGELAAAGSRRVVGGRRCGSDCGGVAGADGAARLRRRPPADRGQSASTSRRPSFARRVRSSRRWRSVSRRSRSSGRSTTGAARR